MKLGLLTGLGLGALLWAMGPGAQGALALAITGVSHDASRGLLVVEGDGPLPSPRVQRLNAPPRLVIDLPGVTAQAAGNRPGIPGTPITRVRVGQYMAGTARVVLDLSSPVSYPVVSSGSELLVSLNAASRPDASSASSRPNRAEASLRAVFWHRGALVASFDRRPSSPSGQLLPGQPPVWSLRFPGAKAGPGLDDSPRPLNQGGISRYRVLEDDQGLKLELSLSRPGRVVALPGGTGYRLNFIPSPVARNPAERAVPLAVRSSAPNPSPRPTPTPDSPPAQDNPGGASSITLRKVGEGWELSLTGSASLRATATSVGQDRIMLDLKGNRLTFPRDSVYIDNGLIARVRAAPKGPGQLRLTLDFDQAVRYRMQRAANGRRYVLALTRSGAPRVTLDPGHGGTDHGTVGQGGTREKDVTLAIAQRLARMMEADGVAVQMTRMRDLEILLRPRVELANRATSDVFVSIHANSFPGNRAVSGVETYYYTEESYGLAQAIHRKLVNQLGRPDRGVRRNNFYVVHHTRMPAALVELGYLSNSAEEALLRDPAYQEKAAAAIHAGIQEFLATRRNTRH